MKFILTLLILFVLGSFLVPVITAAVECPPGSGNDNGLNLCYPEVGGFSLSSSMKIEQIVAWLYTFLIMISGLAAFVMIVYGGVKWMTSSGDTTATSDAKDKIKMALLGLLLVLASFLILQIINPELTTLKGLSLSGIRESEFQSGSGPAYRCEPLGGIDKNFKCDGNLPIVEQGSGGQKEQCITTQSSSNSGNCPTQCRSAGGESARVAETWHCCNVPSPKTGNCTAGGKTFTFAQTTENRPLMQSIMRSRPGVYGCDDDGCLKAWRKFRGDTADVCENPPVDSSPKDKSLCGEIGSLWINGDSVAVLYEDKDYAGKRICFDNRKITLGTAWKAEGVLINRLDDFEIAPNNGWNKDTDSIKILKGEGDLGGGVSTISTICPAFKTTLEETP